MRSLLHGAALAFATLWLSPTLMPAARAADPLRIIVFGAHPDDCELDEIRINAEIGSAT